MPSRVAPRRRCPIAAVAGGSGQLRQHTLAASPLSTHKVTSSLPSKSDPMVVHHFRLGGHLSGHVSPSHLLFTPFHAQYLFGQKIVLVKLECNEEVSLEIYGRVAGFISDRTASHEVISNS